MGRDVAVIVGDEGLGDSGFGGWKLGLGLDLVFRVAAYDFWEFYFLLGAELFLLGEDLFQLGLCFSLLEGVAPETGELLLLDFEFYCSYSL